MTGKFTNETAILGFWRDVEVLNIPAAPKIRNRNDEQFLTLEADTPLPWAEGHPGYLESKKGREWMHTVYLGVADMEKLAQMVIQRTCPTGQFSENDRQQLGGNGYLGIFTLNGQGLIDNESYVPASFVIGLAQLQNDNHLFDIKDALQKAEDRFKERRKGQISGADNTTESIRRPSASRKDIEAELQELLKPVASISEHITFQVVIKSSCGRKEVDLLNSFYLTDLDGLIAKSASNSLGAALSAYLGKPSSSESRRDILVQHEAMARAVSAAGLPLGRWPSSKSHHLMLAQQAAVNQICAMHNSRGLISVNGPPGTGKTTLLCDVIADVVVRRGQLLAEMPNSWHAFENKSAAGGLDFYRLKQGIVGGTGIVVSSSNNAAVENITKDLPTLGKISTADYPDAGYFKDVASQVAAAANIQGDVWGMVAAALGNQYNRRRFIEAFYPSPAASTYRPGEPCDMRSALKAQDGVAKEVSDGAWQDAKREFLDLLKRVQSIREGFARAENLCAQIRGIETEMATAKQTLQNTPARLEAARAKGASTIHDAEQKLALATKTSQETKEQEQDVQLALDAALTHLKIAEQDAALGVIERLLKLVGMQSASSIKNEKRLRAERQNFVRLQDAMLKKRAVRRDAEQHEAQRKHQFDSIREAAAEACQKITAAAKASQSRQLAAGEKLQQFAREIRAMQESGLIVPDAQFFALPAEKRHLKSVWVTEEFDELRGQLFLAALKLHEATLRSCHWKAMKNLAAVRAMLSQSTPHPLTEAERMAVWDMLFFVVPVVSTTLASFDRLFDGMGRESLGWLLIDEAGQATPQSVAGALWRSRRAVVIGDPFQIEPVMTVPSAVIAELANRYGVGPEWSPALHSAQTLADRTMCLGAYVGSGPDAIWTGMPLRAHRRCIDPMFKVANAIAYEGQMAQANSSPNNVTSPLGESAWIDVKGTSAEAQVVKEEIDAFARMLARLKASWPTMGNGKAAEVYVISPFKLVANAAWHVINRAGMGRNPEMPIYAGTVHTFQGKEAEIVILILGSQPGKAGGGSRAWVSQKPNLLNVALTRAKLRIYVIGNSEDWGTCPQFDVLLSELKITPN